MTVITKIRTTIKWTLIILTASILIFSIILFSLKKYSSKDVALENVVENAFNIEVVDSEFGNDENALNEFRKILQFTVHFHQKELPSDQDVSTFCDQVERSISCINYYRGFDEPYNYLYSLYYASLSYNSELKEDIAKKLRMCLASKGRGHLYLIDFPRGVSGCLQVASETESTKYITIWEKRMEKGPPPFFPNR